MVAAGFIVEQVILGCWSVVLFVLYGLQLYQDISIEQIVDMQTGATNSTIVFRRTKSIGYTAYIFHLGGVIGCLILVIRSLDPFPVLGIYPFVATDLLSHIGIAVLLNTLFEGIGSIASKLYYKLNLPVNENFLQKWIRIISYTTLLVAFITWIVENFVSNLLMYSAGVYFLYGTIIQWIIFILFSRMLRIFKGQLGPNSPLLKDRSIRESIKKLQWIQFLFVTINVALTIYQIFVFANQIKNRSTVESLNINHDSYKPISAPLYLTQIAGYSILMWFCYIPADKAGVQAGLSEASEMTNVYGNVYGNQYVNGNGNGNQSPNQPNFNGDRTQNDKRTQNHTSIQEVVVKFKSHEMDPKMKVLDSEELKRTTINRQITYENSNFDEPNTREGSIYPTDTIRSTADTDLSSDQQGPLPQDELRRLMHLIEQQEQAAKEGKLDPQEYITRPDDSAFLMNQIQAMKDLDIYERIRSNRPKNVDNYSISSGSSAQNPPTPPVFDPSQYSRELDRTSRKLFVVPDDELGYTSSSSDLSVTLSKSRIPILKKG